jgi:hypothetical protein
VGVGQVAEAGSVGAKPIADWPGGEGGAFIEEAGAFTELDGVFIGADDVVGTTAERPRAPSPAFSSRRVRSRSATQLRYGAQ